MKSNREMRQEAWKAATTKWSFRFVLTVASFMLLFVAVFVPLTHYFRDNSIQTWGDFCRSQAQFAQSGLALSVPSSQQFWLMTWASGLQNFLEMLAQGIFLFAIVSVALRAVRRDDGGWFGAVFGGFRAPFGMLWLNLLMSLRIMLWSLLFVIPGVIAAFRYSMAWYVKVDHPDYGAAECLAESARLMKGNKWRLFRYGLSYIGWVLLVLVMSLLSFFLIAAVPLVGTGVMAVSMALIVFTVVYACFGQAVFYEELKCLAAGSEAAAPELISEQSETSVES